jgi:uncharacterized protein (DUF433 family)
MSDVYSLREAAAIAELSPDTIRTAVEKKSFAPSGGQKVGKVARHVFSASDVLLVKVLAAFPFPLSKEDKQCLARVINGAQRQAGRWSLRGGNLIYVAGDMQLTIDCKPIRQRLKENQSAYRWGKRRVVSSPDVLAGEAVFRGTRIPVEHVSSLFRKHVPEQEIAEDFPALSVRDLAYARLLSRMGSKPGRPRKRIILDRAAKAA